MKRFNAKQPQRSYNFQDNFVILFNRALVGGGAI